MRTEDILVQVETLLTGLTTTGTNVQREQAYDIETANMPAIVIYEGEDNVTTKLMQSFIDWVLTIDIDIVSRGDKNAVITEINTIRGEIHAALMADYQIGLAGFVKVMEPVRTERPDVSSTGDMPMVRQRLTYEVQYRTNWNNFV